MIKLPSQNIVFADVFEAVPCAIKVPHLRRPERDPDRERLRRARFVESKEDSRRKPSSVPRLPGPMKARLNVRDTHRLWIARVIGRHGGDETIRTLDRPVANTLILPVNSVLYASSVVLVGQIVPERSSSAPILATLRSCRGRKLLCAKIAGIFERKHTLPN